MTDHVMTDHVRCPHCGTTLEFCSGGIRFRFTAHTEAFCRDMTRQRVKDLERALVQQREAFEHANEQLRRHVDKILSNAGLPTLEERAKHAERERSVLAGGLP